MTDGTPGVFTAPDSLAYFQCMVYDEKQKRLLACNNGVTSWRSRPKTEVRLGKAHHKPVIATLYNPVFHEVSCVCVCVWIGWGACVAWTVCA